MSRGGFLPEEALTLEQALALYTFHAADNGFDPAASMVREGLKANLTLLDSSVEGMHPALFRKVGVAATIVRGQLVYGSPGGIARQRSLGRG
jgi:predicted amidohydrolase YtcJ